MKRGHGQRVGDDPNAESVRKDFGHSQADAIDGNGPLKDEVFEGCGVRDDLHQPICTAFLQNPDPGGSINMTRDKMAVEAAIGRQGAFKVNWLADHCLGEGCALPGFVQQIKFDSPALFGGCDCDCCKATAVDCDTIPQTAPLPHCWSQELETNGLFALGDGFNQTCFFNDSGEHMQSRLEVESGRGASSQRPSNDT